MSLKLASGDDMDVSVVRFIEESEAEMSETRPDLVLELRSEVDEVERELGEVGGCSDPYSAK